MSQGVPGDPRRSQEVLGVPRKSHDVPGGPRRSQEAPGRPRTFFGFLGFLGFLGFWVFWGFPGLSDGPASLVREILYSRLWTTLQKEKFHILSMGQAS